eukprot:2010449-Pleurochrysis_carterae.AAC.2
MRRKAGFVSAREERHQNRAAGAPLRLRSRRRDGDVGEPLDHPPADVAGDDEAERVAVVGEQTLAWEKGEGRTRKGCVCLRGEVERACVCGGGKFRGGEK